MNLLTETSSASTPAVNLMVSAVSLYCHGDPPLQGSQVIPALPARLRPRPPAHTSFVFQRSRSLGSAVRRGTHSSSLLGRNTFLCPLPSAHTAVCISLTGPASKAVTMETQVRLLVPGLTCLRGNHLLVAHGDGHSRSTSPRCLPARAHTDRLSADPRCLATVKFSRPPLPDHSNRIWFRTERKHPPRPRSRVTLVPASGGSFPAQGPELRR